MGLQPIALARGHFVSMTQRSETAGQERDPICCQEVQCPASGHSYHFHFDFGGDLALFHLVDQILPPPIDIIVVLYSLSFLQPLVKL